MRVSLTILVNTSKSCGANIILIATFITRRMQIEESGVHKMFTRSLVPNKGRAVLFIYTGQLCLTYYCEFNSLLMMCI